jgi:hypothetical protein
MLIFAIWFLSTIFWACAADFTGTSGGLGARR